jgi:hypothetical protein
MVMNEIDRLNRQIYLLNIEKGIYQAIAGTVLILVILYGVIQ